MNRYDFLNQKAPENYVAGLGRGATGFTTRSDLGPAREGPSEEQIREVLAKRAEDIGLKDTAFASKPKKGAEEENEQEDRFQDPDDEVGLFASGSFDRDDDEADRLYQDVDERMERRRKVQREEREKKEREDYERNNPKIQQQFSDLKRALSAVTDEEWANLPEAKDNTGKNKRQRQKLHQRAYAVPDSVIAGASANGQFETSVQDDGAQTAVNGNGGSSTGTMTNFADIGRARDKVLQVRLDQAAQGSATETTGSATSIDPKGYLTNLTKAAGLGDYQLGDVNRVRTLLEGVVKANPKHAPGWIACARLEELAGKVVAARNVIARGAEMCPKSTDLWLENIRLNDKHNAKIIVATAIRQNDRSIRLWLEAANLEDDLRAKKRVLRQAIDHNPTSSELFKAAVNLEDDPTDAKLLLARAVELIPMSVELWLALARLETPEQAQVILNKARIANPSSYEVWLAALRLQEQLGQSQKVVDTVMYRAVKALAKESSMPKRDDWIAEAERCEEDGALLSCTAIVRNTLGWDLEEDDNRKDVWIGEARQSATRGKYATARAILAMTLQVFPTSRGVWLQAAELERNHGTKEALWQTLEKAIKACPQSEELPMLLAKEKQAAGQLDEARRVLLNAFNILGQSEDIWLAAVKLESDAGEIGNARDLLAEAREQANTARIFVKSVVFERTQRDATRALDLVNDALLRYPQEPKLHMMKGQIYEHDHAEPKFSEARNAYAAGMKACPTSAPLWILAARLEMRKGITVRARSILDRARLAVPKNPDLYLESVRIERRANNLAGAKNMMSRALQEVPAARSGSLWAERIWHLEPRNQRKANALDAIKKVEGDPELYVSVARIFWAERRLEKAASWFEKALVLKPDHGDTWVWYLKFLCEYGTREKRDEAMQKFVVSEPKHGEIWQSVAKDPANANKSLTDVLELAVEQIARED